MIDFNELDLDSIPDLTRKLSSDVGLTIRTLRREHGFTQEKLALDVGVSPMHLSKIERGLHEAKIETILRLCWGMRISAGVFMEKLEDQIINKK